MPKDENKKYEPGDVLDLETLFIVLAVPESTVELDINAKVYINHEVHEVTRHMDFSEVRDAIRDAMTGYIPSDAIFTLAPTKSERIERLVKSVLVEDDN